MPDVFSPEKRSQIMSRIKGKDTLFEMRVRKWLHERHVGYRKNCTDLPGKPDLVITRWKTVVFINGCFWHGHEGCKYFVVPRTRTDWWLDKIGKTAAGDVRNCKVLTMMGWKVIVLWECDLKRDFEGCMQSLVNCLKLQGYQPKDGEY